MSSRRVFLKAAASFAGAAALPACADTAAQPTVARFWHKSGDAVACELCPNGCILKEGIAGICRTRRNDNGRLVTFGYGNPCAVHVDPIEKKPLYHVLPGARTFSIAVAGCNFRCKNCQNHTISQTSPHDTRNVDLPPRQVVDRAVKANCGAIAYTYSEPTVWYEYMYDTARLARKAGLKNLLITCGYINEEPLIELARFVDAANIDLKGFDAQTYRRLNAGRLEAVLATLSKAKELGIWVEVTNLVVPGWTDSIDTIREMCVWVREHLGADTPLHFSRFHPMYKLAHLPPTPRQTLEQARLAALESGLSYVYLGNVAGANTDTRCPSCSKAIVRRRGYLILENNVTKGACAFCGRPVAGIWDA